MNPGSDNISGGSGSGVSLAALRESFASLYASLENMREIEGPELHTRYVALFGEENLTLFSLAVEATELRSLVRLVQASAPLDDAAKERIRREAKASTAPYRRRMELRSMEYIVSDMAGCAVKRRDELLLSLLKRASVMVFATNIPRPVARGLFGRLETLFSNRDVEGMRSLVEELKAESAACDRDDDNERRERASLEKAIAITRAEIDELNMTYPYIMRSRLAEKSWIRLEHERLQREIANLRLKLDELSARVRELGF